jgi:hypothetical protein
MQYNLITASFVGVWEKPFLNIPAIDRKFCLDLFGDPYSTTCTMSPEGFVIAKQFQPPPHPSVIINPNRIQITELSISRVCEITSTILGILKNTNTRDMIHPFASIGINMEHEWIGLKDTTEVWLRNKFFKNVFFDPDIESINPYDVRFEIKIKGGWKYNILLQPRAGQKNSLFVGVNDDRFWSEKTIPSEDQFMDLFTDSAILLKRKMESILE